MSDHDKPTVAVGVHLTEEQKDLLVAEVNRINDSLGSKHSLPFAIAILTTALATAIAHYARAEHRAAQLRVTVAMLPGAVQEAAENLDAQGIPRGAPH